MLQQELRKKMLLYDESSGLFDGTCRLWNLRSTRRVETGRMDMVVRSLFVIYIIILHFYIT